jgi:hypothetical protein
VGPRAHQADIVRDFKQAWEAKDIGALIRLLDPDAVMTADGGGLATAALRPIQGRENVARYALGIADKTADVTILERNVNGQPGLVVQQADATVSVVAFTVTSNRISHIWAVRNPEKLRSWPTVPEITVSENSKMDGSRSAVVVGGGIGGLTAAVALRRVGWRVTVLERAARFGEIGAGITLMSNGLRCLDAIGLGDAVRGSGQLMLALGMRSAAGRWLSRFDGDGADLEALMGTTAVVVHRAELHRILPDALPSAALLAGVATTGIRGGADGGPAEVRLRHLDHDALLQADLVVGADGVHSWVRAQRWPDAPAPVYSGSTSWRAVTAASSAAVTEMSLSWGRGTECGVMPLVDGRTYWYAAANADEAQRNRRARGAAPPIRDLA